MAQDIIALIRDSAQYALGIYGKMLLETNLTAWVLFCFLIYTVYRFIIAPLVGAVVSGGASDLAAEVRGKNSYKYYEKQRERREAFNKEYLDRHPKPKGR